MTRDADPRSVPLPDQTDLRRADMTFENQVVCVMGAVLVHARDVFQPRVHSMIFPKRAIMRHHGWIPETEGLQS